MFNKTLKKIFRYRVMKTMSPSDSLVPQAVDFSNHVASNIVLMKTKRSQSMLFCSSSLNIWSLPLICRKEGCYGKFLRFPSKSIYYLMEITVFERYHLL